MGARLAAVGIVVLLVAAGCGGGGGGSSEEDEYAAALADSMQAAMADKAPVSDRDARCVGDGVVDVVGVESFQEAGLSPEDIRGDSDRDLGDLVSDPTSQQAKDLVDVLFDCLDMGAVFAAGFQASAAEDDVRLPQEKVECIGDNFERSERLRELFARSILQGSDPDFDGNAALLGEILGDCLSVADLLEIGAQVDESTP